MERFNRDAKINEIYEGTKEIQKNTIVSALNEIARRLNPAHDAMLAPFREPYYWSIYQSEWAMNILFNLLKAWPEYTQL